MVAKVLLPSCKGVEVVGDLVYALIIVMIDLGIHGANMYDIIRYGICQQ